MTLLEKARKPSKPRAGVTKHPQGELSDLAVAWLQGDVRNIQLAEALGRKPWAIAGCVITVMNALRREVIDGKIELRPPREPAAKAVR